ncbi:MAG: substrate-binding domain-containing protein [Anaerolineae bacterium]
MLFVLAACQSIGGGSPAVTLRIVSGSENSTLAPIIQDWAKSQGYAVEMTYLGSLDIARMLQTGSVPYDAVWPANRLWLDYGDTHNMVKHDESIHAVARGFRRQAFRRRTGRLDRQRRDHERHPAGDRGGRHPLHDDLGDSV